MKNGVAQPVTRVANMSVKSLGVSKETRVCIVKELMSVIILKELGNDVTLSGYDIIALFRRKFRVFFSAGSVYSMLSVMEKEGLIEGTMTDGKRTYKLTEKGEAKIQEIVLNLDSILSFVRSILGERSLSKLL